MAKSKQKSKPDQQPIPVWVYKNGIKDIDGNTIPVESYAYVAKEVDGTQPANTDPLDLKFYQSKKRVYKTSVMKADTEEK